MNRKNTILIAVMINAGLLAVLLIAALTTQDNPPPVPALIAEAPSLPKFDDQVLFTETLPLRNEVVMPEPVKPIEILTEPEPLLHKLPPLVSEPAPVVVAPPAPQSVIAATPHNELTVKKGDNLEKIAKINHTTVDEIIKMNHLTNTFLKVGQVLKIPTERSLPKVLDKKPIELGPEYYTMKVGDNPWAIAMKHHMKVEELLRLNGLNEERARKLKPGDRLRIR